MKTIAAFLTLVLCLAAAAAPAGGYRLLKKIPVPGDGSFDYLNADSAGRRLYVSHGTEVNVLDLDSDAVVGKIPDTKGVHGIAFAPEVGRGFTSNGGDSTITMFDLKTLKVLGQIKSSGQNPDAIIYDPASKRVFAMNGRSGSTTAIDPAKGTVVGTVELGGKPEFAVADGKGLVYVNLEDKSNIAVFDSRTLTLKKTWPLAPCEEPSAMSWDKKTGRLFVGCGNHLMAVVDAATGKVITTLPIGDHVDAGVFDPDSGMIFFSCGDGTLSVIHEDSADKYSAVQTVQTMAGAKTMTMDAKTHKMYLSTAEFGPPAEGQKGRRRTVKPGTFQILVVGK